MQKYEIRSALEFLIKKGFIDTSIRQLNIFLMCANGENTVRGITAKLGCTKASVTRAIDKFQKLGYVSRKPANPGDDKRVVTIHLTASGKKLAANFL